MKFNMEVVEEIWVARVKGQEGEVELTIMPYYYCNLWDVFWVLLCTEVMCTVGVHILVVWNLSRVDIAKPWLRSYPRRAWHENSPQKVHLSTFFSQAAGVPAWKLTSFGHLVQQLPKPGAFKLHLEKRIEWHPPNDIFENWVSEISWPNSDWCISNIHSLKGRLPKFWRSWTFCPKVLPWIVGGPGIDEPACHKNHTTRAPSGWSNLM